jgi:16S rRNA (guanine527-N7)-methyltransferase
MTGASVESSDALLTVEILKSGLSRWGIELSDVEQRSFAEYAEMLVEWNETRFNLTRLVSPQQIALNHFLDSIVLSQIVKVPHNVKLIDVGTGPGFPGLAFKAFRPDINLTLIESTAKKLSFCRAVAEKLSLSKIDFVHGRAEDLSVLRHYGRSAEIITARAVAPLKTLLEWITPLAAAGGTIVAWKGPKVLEEVADSKITASRLGIKIEVVEKLLSVLNTEPIAHYYVICHVR